MNGTTNANLNVNTNVNVNAGASASADARVFNDEAKVARKCLLCV